ncbi:MAG TPA: hypothetical protein G4O16_00820 [Dehalococcoidia bacterium]|nr:hypothetical protein [Dehalococcoidia bacterium]
MINTMLEIARKTPLRPIYRWGRRKYLNLYLKSTMGKILADPEYLLNDRNTLTDLSRAWGNMSYSASIEYLEECVQYSAKSRLPILECGSGLSTIVIGLIAKKYGNIVWSLEHMKSWYERIKKALIKYEIDSVKINYGPMTEYGDYVWYKAPLDSMPDKFSLVVCDGPAGVKTRAKHNIFPIMKERFAPDCVILYDDANKVIPEDAITDWVEKLNMSYEIHGEVNPYYVFKL